MSRPVFMKRLATSLHARLILWLLALLGTVWVALWTNTWGTAVDTATRDVDQRLRITATLLLSLYTGQTPANVSGGLPTALPPVGSTLLKMPAGMGWETPVNFEVVSFEHGLVTRTPDFPTAARDASVGFNNRDIGDRRWRIFTLDDPRQGLVSRVAVQQSIGSDRANTLRDDFAWPLIWLLPVFALLAVFSVWSGLAPLRRIERAIDTQDPLAPRPMGINRDRVPMELRRLVDTLDHLMHRVGEVLTRQRAFTAGAGHELRTPLAGCRSQLQVAQRSREDESRQRALDKALHTLDHMSSLVDQLLTLARVDPAASELDTRPLEFGRLVRRLVAERQDAAASDGVELALKTPEDISLPIEGNVPLMETLVSNLLDNAIRFSPTGATVQVHLEPQGDRACLRIRDQGPGIHSAELDHLFDPFFSSQSHGKGSNGLGLAIVQAVAKAHGGEAKALQPEHGGAAIIVYLPLTRR
ncbi:sensor histidine kinase [Halomonas sp.]|uniref:sensor histidine kinase n=1 Tax=Halomonas sp. TaxID=1486246 RepID=UPI00298E35F5|nr:ATP-binding protein [Halomonas sp.]MDW7749051.1 ATP-binding protein [Halomonas sp.]